VAYTLDTPTPLVAAVSQAMGVYATHAADI
jgi:hypothetical protein